MLDKDSHMCAVDKEGNSIRQGQSYVCGRQAEQSVRQGQTYMRVKQGGEQCATRTPI